MTGAAIVHGAAQAAAPDRIVGAASATESAVRVDPPTPAPPATATYRVDLTIAWDGTTHPTTLPPNSHISPPVVVTHGEVGDLFVRGAPASDGIERMAEVGSTTTLRAELGADGTVSSVQTGSSLFGSGERSFDVTVDLAHPFVSLVTMLAPSPDWFVGVRDVSLLTGGQWTERAVVDLANYDAGTDSGTSWTSPNADTRPAGVIGGPIDPAFVAAVAEAGFGTVTFTRTG